MLLSPLEVGSAVGVFPNFGWQLTVSLGSTQRQGVIWRFPPFWLAADGSCDQMLQGGVTHAVIFLNSMDEALNGAS